MIVKRLVTFGFRNLDDFVFEPGKLVNILYGSNAQGKTNLLEALWLFTGSRSFRGSKDAELLKFGTEKGQLILDYETVARAQQIKLTLTSIRSAQQNGIALDSPLKLSGEFCAVIFSPEHLGLVKEGPQLRRKFIDSAICQLMPRYIFSVLEYKKILTHRNALLKDIPFHASLLETLDIWDEKLSVIGAHIIFTRMRYLKKLSEKASLIYAGISKNSETLLLSYSNHENFNYFCDLDHREEALKALTSSLFSAMKKMRETDLACGYTHAGPHRDDLQISISGISARTFGSQGQQRTAVLSLKLAEAAVLWDTTGEPPVLLLDDVMSELDSSRQDYLLNNIDGMQVFITCCDPTFQGALKNGSVFEVKNGSVRLNEL